MTPSGGEEDHPTKKGGHGHNPRDVQGKETGTEGPKKFPYGHNLTATRNMIQENEDPGDSGGADIQATEGQRSKYPRGRNWAAKVAYSAEVPKCVSTCETGRAQKAMNGECPGDRNNRIPVSQRKRNLKHTEDRWR